MAQYTLPTKATVTRPVAKGYNALIGDIYVRLLTSDEFPLVDVTADPTPDEIQTAVNPEDFGEAPGKTFSRMDFRGGEGLDMAHQRNLTERDTTRYWDSRNVDVARNDGVFQHITLLHDTSQIFDETDTNLALATNGSSIWWARGNDVQRSDDPTVTAPSEVTENPHAGQGAVAVQDLAFLGDQLHAALDTSGIHQRTAGGTWSHWSDLQADRVWGVKGRVIAADGTGLYEAASGAGSTLLHTLPSGQTWNDVVDAGAAILAAASDGYIYAFLEQSGQLALQGRTQILGETPTRLGFGQGFVFYTTTVATQAGGTVARLWRAELTSGLTVEGGQVLRKWGADDTAQTRTPGPILVTRNFAWVAVEEDGTETHLWRYHFETGGMSRDLILGVSGACDGLVMVNERLIATIEADGVWHENDTYAASGYLITPLADFFTAKDKQWVGATVWTPDLPASTTVGVEYTTDPDAITDPSSTSWISLITLTSGQGGQEVTIPQTESRWMAAKITLAPNTARSARPKATGVALRAFPAIDDVVLDLPVNISDHIERPNRKRIRVRGQGQQLFHQIKLMEGTPRLVEVLRPPLKVRGLIEKVSTPITRVSERGSATLVTIVRVRGTKEITSGGTSPAATALGIPKLGVSKMGV